MSELLWEDVQDFFVPAQMGSFPDAWVDDTTAANWQAVFTLVRTSGWRWEYQEEGFAEPVPPAAEMFTRPEDALIHMRVWPAQDVLMIFRPRTADRITFDVALKELQSQRGIDVLCDFLGAIGRLLDKPVFVGAEGTRRPILGFDPGLDTVVLFNER